MRGAATDTNPSSSSSRFEPLLVVDCSGAGAGLALRSGGQVRTASLASSNAGPARTEDLAGQAARLLAEQGLSATQLVLLGGVVGPGSYTGLRSGLAFLRGLAFDGSPRAASAGPAGGPGAGGSPRAVAIGSLELLAYRAAMPGETVAACWPATEGRLVIACYRRDDDDVVELVQAQLLAAGDPARWRADLAQEPVALLVSNGQPQAHELARASGIPLRVAEGDALEQLAALVLSRAAADRTMDVDAMLPLYVGQSSARPNRNRVAVAAP